MTGGDTREGWDFFLSYTQADKAWAEWIAWVLEEDSHRVLIQAWDFVPGTNWIHEMQAGIDQSTRTIAILSPDYLTSVYGSAEWQAIWAVDPTGNWRNLLVVRVTDCRRPGLLAGVVGVDLFGLDDAAATAQLRAMVKAAVSGRAKPAVKPKFPGAMRAVPREPQFPGPEEGQASVATGRRPHKAVDEATSFGKDRKSVMVIYGEDTEANVALFDWLRAIGLQPLEWSQLVSASGAASPYTRPYIGQVIAKGFEQAQAVIALLTPDERVIAAQAAEGDKAWRLQARPNVLIEAGMAMATHPDRTILVVLGPQEQPSDLAGLHYIRLSPGDPLPLHDLAERLRIAGCEIDLTRVDWRQPRRFPDRTITKPPPGRREKASEEPVHQARHPYTNPTLILPGGDSVAPVNPGQRTAKQQPSRPTCTLTGHEDAVEGVAFSPDGVLLATASSDNTARLWGTATGKCILTLTGHTEGVLAVAFRPYGTLLAIASGDQTARLWHLATGKCIQTFTGHKSNVNDAAVSPDGTLLATASGDQTARLWDLATGRCIRTLTGHAGPLMSVAFRPDGVLLATASSDNTARLWGTATGKCTGTLVGHSHQLWQVAFSPDGTLLATASEDKAVGLWDATTYRCIRVLTRHTAMVCGVAFSPDGTLLATASADKTARLWDVTTAKCVRTLGHTEPVYGVAFSPDGTLLATASADMTARIWS